MFHFVEVLRAIAVVLITNSHFKGVYPNDILSFGGGLGLALFYMISGYLLANVRNETTFRRWYLKKIMRLVVPLVIFKAIVWAIGVLEIKSWGSFVRHFVFPGSWFGASMIVFYALLFWFVKCVYRKYTEKSIYIAIGMLFMCYVLLFVSRLPLGLFSLETLKIHDTFSIETPYLITQCVWMICILMGVYIRKKVCAPDNTFNLRYLLGAVLNVLLFLIVKLLSQNAGRTNFEFLLAVSYIGFAYCLFIWAMSNEKLLGRIFETGIGKVIGLISKCSLEIYYVQTTIIVALRGSVFPINFILICVVIGVCAYTLHIVSQRIFDFCWRKH